MWCRRASRGSFLLRLVISAGRSRSSCWRSWWKPRFRISRHELPPRIARPRAAIGCGVADCGGSRARAGDCAVCGTLLGDALRLRSKWLARSDRRAAEPELGGGRERLFAADAEAAHGLAR